MRKEKITIDLQGTQCVLTPINAIEYYNLHEKSIAIDRDPGFYLDLYYSLRTQAPDFLHPHLYAALKTLFGESSTLYDDFKCSFGFPFMLDIAKGKKKSKYILNVTDLKGGLNFIFSKVLPEDELGKYDLMLLYKPFEREFSREEMRYFINFFSFYLVGFWESFGEKYDEEYFRSLNTGFYVYGYVDGKFFGQSYEDYDDFHDAIQELKKRNIPYNKVKPNPGKVA